MPKNNCMTSETFNIRIFKFPHVQMRYTSFILRILREKEIKSNEAWFIFL